jgi:ABC-type branched-subunit amino acid transport system substrate-binding protein
MRARSAKTIIGALAAISISLTAGGCAKGAQSNANTNTSDGALLYGTDGNMANSFGDSFKDSAPGMLAGMKGTVPLTPLTEDFKRRLKGVDPGLTDFNYSAESYDAVVVAGLAAETARSVDPANIAKQLIGVTTGDTECDTLAVCLTYAKTGKRIRYKGISLQRSGFTQTGEPSTAMYGVVTFGRDNLLEDAKTEYVSAGDEKTESKTPPPAVISPKSNHNSTPLKIGILLPKTGGLSFQGPPMFAAVKLAVKELNEAGGVLNQPVALEEGDDGTSPDVAGATVDRFIGLGVHVIIGAAASGVSKAVLPKVVAAGKVMISPSATSDELSTLDDKGLFFRTSPPDVLQAKALTDIIMRGGHQRVAVVARDDSYGKGLAGNVQANLGVAGIKPSDIKVTLYPAKDTYDPKVDTDGIFKPIAKDLKGFQPDAVLLIGFDESAFVIKAMVADGVKIRS